MAKVTTLQSNFTGGELSPRLDGRVDITKFKTGARVIENMTVLPHGGARKRSGFQFVAAQRSVTEAVILVPFQYNVEQSYVLMFGPGYIWFFKDRGIITATTTAVSGVTQANPGVVTSTAHGLSPGDRVVLTNLGGMTELNNRQFTVGAVTTDTFELSGVSTIDYDAYTSGGTAGRIIQLTTSYSESDLSELTFAQTNDVLYVAHRNHPLRKISRLSHTSWTLSAPAITTGPFRSINADRDLRISVSGFSTAATAYGTYAVGTTLTLTSTGSIFAPGMVGGLFKLAEEGGSTGVDGAAPGDSTKTVSPGLAYTSAGNVYGVAQTYYPTPETPYGSPIAWSFFTRVPEHDAGTVRVRGGTQNGYDAVFLHPTYCIVRITAYASSTSVTAEVVRYHLPKSVVDSGTTYWYEGAWSDHRGYPRALAFYEQRLFLGGSNSDPTVLWSSRSGSYEDFTDGTDDDDAILYRINAGSADVIRWLMSGRVLTAGTSMGEFAISASNQNEALTPKNFKAAPQTTYGTAQCIPIRFGQTVLYPQRNGDPTAAARKLREFSYSFESDSFTSVDLTVFSEHITGTGVDRVAFQLQPEPVIWSRRTDGQAATCTYERAQEVVAWHRQVPGGINAQIMTLAVIPGPDGDDVWISTERLLGEATDLITEDGLDLITEDGFDLITEDTETVRYIEVSHPPFRDDDDKEDAKILDCMLTYSGPSTTTLSGLHHLRGLEVKVLNNGSVETHTVDLDGRITLNYATTKSHVGLPYTAILETEDFEAGAQAGTAQSRAKRISQVWLRLLNSLGGRYGPDADTLVPIHYRTASDPMGSSPPLFSDIKELDHPGGWERHARVRIEHDEPLPFHVTGLVAEMNVSG